LKADELPDISVATKGMTNARGVGSSSQRGVSVGPEEIRAIVEQALDSRLGPVMRELFRLREERGPGLTEIIGGIGYIFGLMGLVMYFWGKKKRKGGK
jgi:nickel transport protein